MNFVKIQVYTPEEHNICISLHPYLQKHRLQVRITTFFFCVQSVFAHGLFRRVQINQKWQR